MPGVFVLTGVNVKLLLGAELDELYFIKLRKRLRSYWDGMRLGTRLTS